MWLHENSDLHLLLLWRRRHQKPCLPWKLILAGAVHIWTHLTLYTKIVRSSLVCRTNKEEYLLIRFSFPDKAMLAITYLQKCNEFSFVRCLLYRSVGPYNCFIFQFKEVWKRRVEEGGISDEAEVWKEKDMNASLANMPPTIDSWAFI